MNILGFMVRKRVGMHLHQVMLQVRSVDRSKEFYTRTLGFKLLYDFSNRNGITDLFTLGLPELRSVYRFAFFVARPEQCKHPIGNRRVQLMHLDLVDVRARYSHSRHPVARLLFQEPRANPVIAP